MRKSILLALLVLTGFAWAQNPVEEAKHKREEEHHAMLVQKAKDLLAEKEQLEKSLAEVNGKLEKLAQGQDVKEEAQKVSDVAFPSALTLCNCCCVSTGGWSTTGAVYWSETPMTITSLVH